MHPRNFTHITARMPAPWGAGREGALGVGDGQGMEARAFLHFPSRRA